jgi:hypothetical protein
MGGFAYMPWGPADPPIPTQYAVLAASAGSPPRCDDAADAQPAGDFWALAFAVCRAIVGEAPWPGDDSVPDPPEPVNAYQACLDEELGTMLEHALAWHREHPDATPKVSYPSDSTRSPCQSRIYELRVLDPSEGSEPTPAGFVPLAITANGIENDPSVAVTVDGAPVDETFAFEVQDPGDGLQSLVVLAPLTDEERTAEVAVSTQFATLTGTVDLPGADEPPP